MIFLYHIFLILYLGSIRLASLLGNQKAALWIRGRSGLFKELSRLPKGERRIWFHCSSLGEFEQGRPVFEKIKQLHSDIKIVLTFFSPSGYEVRKKYAGADYIFYLPMDGHSNALRFVEVVKPEKVFFVKYDFWFFYLKELHSRNIPAYFISSIFRKDQPFFKWYGGFFRKMLSYVTCFFIQDKTSLELLQSIGFKNGLVTGDTRFDRVIQVAALPHKIEYIDEFVDGKKVLVAGSTWKEDETVLVDIDWHAMNTKLIIVPHEVDEQNVKRIVEMFSVKYTVKRYSQMSSPENKEAQVLIIDNIGMLSSLYQYGTIAMIGGGFGKGIHNILEAAVYGLPVIFGSNHKKFNEANELVRRGGAFAVATSSEMRNLVQHLIDDQDFYNKSSAVCKAYVNESAGATARILEKVGL